MKSRILMICCVMLCGGVLPAATDFQHGMSNVLQKVSSSRHWERMQSTNAIDMLVSTTTNADLIAECRLLKAAVLIERAETEFDGAALSEAASLCADIKTEYQGKHDDWRLWGSILVDMQASAAMGNYTNVYAAATNAIALSPPADFERSTNVWCALFGPDIPSRMSLADAFRVNAVDALLSIDRTSDISSLTNGLSLAAVESVAELLSEGDRK